MSEKQKMIMMANANAKAKETKPVFSDEAPVQAEEPSVMDSILNAPSAIGEMFTGNKAAAGAFQDAPEFVSLDKGQLTTPMEGTRDEKSKLMSGLLMSVDPQQKMDVIKAHVPDARFLQRSDGTVIVKVNGQDFWLDKPGVSAAGTVKSLAEMALYIPSMRAGGLTSGFKRLVAGGSAAAGTSAGLDLAAQDFGSQQGVNPMRAGLMFGAGVLGEALPMTMNALSKRAAVKHTGGHEVDLDAAPLAIKEAETLQTKVKDLFGVDFPLFRAQKTNSPTALVEQETMLSNSLGVTASKEALKKQNSAASAAVDAFVDELIPLSLNANLKVHKAAGTAIDLAKLARKQQTSPLYTAATDNPSGVAVNIQSTLNILEEAKVGLPKTGDVYPALNKVNRLLHVESKGGKLTPTTDPKLLHNVKVNIDTMLAKTGDEAVDRTVASHLRTMNQELMKTLKAQVPGYEKAAAEYARLSIPVDDLVNSQIGIIANMKPATVDAVRSRIFAPSASRETQNHTRSIITNVDPKAWQMVLREQVKDLVDKAVTKVDGEKTPAILWQALGGGSDKKTNILRNALSPKEKSSYDVVMSILEQGAKGMPPRVKATVSPKNIGVKDAVTSQIIGRDVASQGLTTRFIINPLKFLTGSSTDVTKLAKVMFDPKWNSELRKIKKMGTGSEKSYRGLLLLLAKVEDDRVNQSPPTETD
jgi:hypothetical protein